MSDVTDADRKRAFRALGWHESWGLDDLSDSDRNEVEDIAAALAEERERERLTWNPMIGRVMQVAQEWARTPLPIWTDKAAERINRAIEGDQ